MTVTERTADTMSLGPLRAAPGWKTRGGVAVDLGEVTVDLPVVLVNGARRGPRLVVTAGVHGGEFTGIAAAARLAADLDPVEVRGHLVICPVVNPPAVYGGRLGVSPLDGVNINRVFPGDADGSPTERLADWLFQHLLPGADAYVDLHAGGIDERLLDYVGYRLSGDDGVDAKAGAMAYAFGYTDVVVGRTADGGNSHAAAARLGIPAVLVETGERGDRDDHTVAHLLGGMRQLLIHLGILAAADGSTPTVPVAREWAWCGEVTAPVTGLWYPRVSPGEDVEVGQPIGDIVDPVDGSRTTVTTAMTGRVFYGMHGLTVTAGTLLVNIAEPLASL